MSAMSKAIAQRENNRSLYIAMCKGKVPQRSISGKPVMGQGHSYHGAISLD